MLSNFLELTVVAILFGATLMGLVAYLETRRLRREHHIQVQLLHNLPMGLCYEYKGHLTINKALCFLRKSLNFSIWILL